MVNALGNERAYKLSDCTSLSKPKPRIIVKPPAILVLNSQKNRNRREVDNKIEASAVCVPFGNQAHRPPSRQSRRQRFLCHLWAVSALHRLQPVANGSLKRPPLEQEDAREKR